MKTILLQAYGGPESLVLTDAPRPQIAEDELLVRVHAAGINPVDWKLSRGYLKDVLAFDLPFAPGYDLSGVVEETGPAVKDFLPGDAVFAMRDLTRPGAYAEYAAVKASEAAAKPTSLDHARAAAVPLAALTAWQGLFDIAGLRAGQKVLVHAAAGGVGHFAVQFARWAGAHVIGTASAINQDFLRQIGAHQTIDYTSQRFEEAVKEVDVVFDLLSGETRERSWSVLKKHGILVSTLPPPPPAGVLEKYEVRGESMLVRPNGRQLGEIAQLIEEGKIQPEVTTYSFSEARRAHQMSEAGHTRGKLVLVIKE
ncbi:MAG: NADP-dependent oxidoreductase [Deltaproteobacteria bacterium]|jgi:NADPH:quinone reductase-like Zn-dependent oxidoreductase